MPGLRPFLSSIMVNDNWQNKYRYLSLFISIINNYSEKIIEKGQGHLKIKNDINFVNYR